MTPPSGRLPVLCLHGWPQSSYMWRHLLPALASTDRRALAPDLPGFGDSPPDPPGTFERQVEAVERFRRQVGLERVVLAVHDTGGLIGLRWACDHPDAVGGLVITNTAFFPDVGWHEIGKRMRTPIQGETLVDSLSREGFATLLEEASSEFDEPALDEYWKAFTTAEGRRGMLELYRSVDLDQLEPYQSRLAALEVPTLILWGQQDEILPPDFASRFARQIPGSQLVMLEGVRHFLFEDAPEPCAEAVIEFLRHPGI
jgi:haloalkane dehalogenase